MEQFHEYDRTVQGDVVGRVESKEMSEEGRTNWLLLGALPRGKGEANTRP